MITKRTQKSALDCKKKTFLLLTKPISFDFNWLKFDAVNSLTKPMRAHAVSCPFGLAYPTPFKTASCPRTNHVHATACSFRGRSTFGARFCENFYGHFGCFVPTRISDTSRIDRVFTGGWVIDGGGVWETFTDVVTLSAIFAEHKLPWKMHQKELMNSRRLKLTPQPLRQWTRVQNSSTMIPIPQFGCGHKTPPACSTNSSVANIW